MNHRKENIVVVVLLLLAILLFVGSAKGSTERYQTCQSHACWQQEHIKRQHHWINTKAGPKHFARYLVVHEYHWELYQFSCLNALWGRESGWSVTAHNPSGAHGIPQALPGAKMASAGPNWWNSFRTQIRWGLNYIATHKLFHTPCEANSYQAAHNYY